MNAMLPLSTPDAPLALTPNPCTLAPHDPAVDLTSIDISAVFARPPNSRPPRREFLDLRACKSAALAIAGFDRLPSVTFSLRAVSPCSICCSSA